MPPSATIPGPLPQSSTVVSPSTGPQQRTGIVAEGGTAHPDDTLGGALQPGWRTGSPWLLDRCDKEAGREEQSSPTFDLR